MKTEKVQWYLNLQTNVKILQVKEFVIIEETKKKKKFPYPTKFGRKYHILFSLFLPLLELIMENVFWPFWM